MDGVVTALPAAGSGPLGAGDDPEGTRLLIELGPTAAALLERHLLNAREWFPHELVPWSRGRDFDGAASAVELSDPAGVVISEPVRSALFVNLLTEDNLPHYFRTIERTFGAEGPWGEWSRRWTAEEGRHSIVLRDYLTVSRLVDPVRLERARMAQVSGGEIPDFTLPLDALAYVALQELATRVSHYNTGKALPDRAGYDILRRVAADENLHHLFYRDLVAAAIELDPSASVEAIDRVVRGFAMPGAGIHGFAGHARAIAKAGIYNLGIFHDQVITPVVLRHWDLGHVEGLTPAAEASRERLMRHIDRLGRLAARSEERRLERSGPPDGETEPAATVPAARAASAAPRPALDDLTPAVIGVTL